MFSKRCFALVLMTLLLATACSGAGDEGRGAAENERGSPTESTEPQAGEDPRVALLEIISAARDQELKEVYERLVPDFHRIEYEEPWVAGLVATITRNRMVENMNERDSWRVERHKSFTVIRHHEFSPIAYVFRFDGEEWRWDPGSVQLVASWLQSLPADERRNAEWLNIGGRVNVVNEKAAGGSRSVPVSYLIHTIEIKDEHVYLGVEWRVDPAIGSDLASYHGHFFEDITVPLEGITWQVGEESGTVDIVWTTANLGDNQLRLKGWPEDNAEHNPTSLRYHFTLRLNDVPTDANEVVLRTEGIELGPYGEDAPIAQREALVVNFEHRVPLETSSEILRD